MALAFAWLGWTGLGDVELPTQVRGVVSPRTVASSAASLAIFVGGMILAVVLGLKRRRDTIAAIEARKQGSSEQVADERL